MRIFYKRSVVIDFIIVPVGKMKKFMYVMVIHFKKISRTDRGNFWVYTDGVFHDKHR